MPHFIFIQQISVLNILNMLYNLHFFSSKCCFFHNATLFGFCIIHILNTGVLIFGKKSVAKRLSYPQFKDSSVLAGFSYKTLPCGSPVQFTITDFLKISFKIVLTLVPLLQASQLLFSTNISSPPCMLYTLPLLTFNILIQ